MTSRQNKCHQQLDRIGAPLQGPVPDDFCNTSKHKYKTLKQPGDGNCFFHCISWWLKKTKGILLPHTDVRQQICDYIETHWYIFAPNGFIDGETEIQQYVHNMRQDGAYGGNPEIRAAGLLWKADIFICFFSDAGDRPVFKTTLFDDRVSKPNTELDNWYIKMKQGRDSRGNMVFHESGKPVLNHYDVVFPTIEEEEEQLTYLHDANHAALSFSGLSLASSDQCNIQVIFYERGFGIESIETRIHFHMNKKTTLGALRTEMVKEFRFLSPENAHLIKFWFSNDTPMVDSERTLEQYSVGCENGVIHAAFTYPDVVQQKLHQCIIQVIFYERGFGIKSIQTRMRFHMNKKTTLRELRTEIVKEFGFLLSKDAHLIKFWFANFTPMVDLERTLEDYNVQCDGGVVHAAINYPDEVQQKLRLYFPSDH
tara:strand:- start:2242 stop:3516 length:1275 start_codon:yes stop_codon:yes gene_type:complete